MRLTTDQEDHYGRLIAERRGTRRLFSCGYYERFDPFLLEHKPFLAPVYDAVFARFFRAPTGTILDVGCGTALYWPLLARHCRRLIGVDVSGAMVREARGLIEQKALANAEVHVGTAEDLTGAASSVDVVLCLDGLHHIPDLHRATGSFHRVLVPGGRLFAFEPNPFNPLIFLAHLLPGEERRAVVRNYAPILRRLFRRYFDDIRIEYVNVVMSAASEAQLHRVAQIGRALDRIPPLRFLSLRQLLFMRRRDVLNGAIS
jgi:SAM-dependent methyltransferase